MLQRSEPLTEAQKDAVAIGALTIDPRPDVHTYFGLSYSTYLVLHRTFLQSMPDEWQCQFVALMEEADAAFAHVEKPDAYKVEPATEEYVSEMSPERLKQLGIVEIWDDGELDHYEYETTGEPIEAFGRIMVPTDRDPIPGYRRGRTRVEPDLVAVEALRAARGAE
jgi:hypothetical protein